MLLSDLLGSVAVDAGGDEVDRVVDVRLEISGAPDQLHPARSDASGCLLGLTDRSSRGRLWRRV